MEHSLEFENPPSTSVSNGHVPHFFSPISIENGSPKFSYPLPNNVHVSKAPLPSDFYTSTLLQYRIADKSIIFGELAKKNAFGEF